VFLISILLLQVYHSVQLCTYNSQKLSRHTHSHDFLVWVSHLSRMVTSSTESQKRIYMSKLLTSTDHGGGIPAFIIRFVMFVPMGIYQAISTNHWNVIRHHPELHSGIYGTRWATGETLTHKWVSLNATLCFIVRSYFHRIRFLSLRADVTYLLSNYPLSPLHQSRVFIC